MNSYYIKNREYIKKRQLVYYHRTKKLVGKKSKVPYYLKKFKNRLKKIYTKKFILWEYDKNTYWRFIQKENIKGRYINETKIFTKLDLKYIKWLQDT